MNKTLALVTALMLALVITAGGYAYAYLTATTAVDVTAAGDEIATAEEAASQPDWDSVLTPTEAAIKILRPNADGDLTEFEDLIGAPTHWEAVDEEVADDATTHVGSDVAGSTDLFALTDSGLAAGTTINSITVYERVRREGSNDEDWQITIRSGNTSAYSPTFSETPTWVERSYQWVTDPNTGGAWTVAAVDALQAGAYVVTGVDVSQVYVEVDYLATALCGDVPTGDLFDITPDDDYSGDLAVKVYLTNTGALVKAYQYLNIKLYLQGSVEAGETPNYRLLTLDNGGVTFSLEDYSPGTYTLSITGGSYCLVSRDTAQWQEGWTVTPELYVQILQR